MKSEVICGSNIGDPNRKLRKLHPETGPFTIRETRETRAEEPMESPIYS